MPLNRRSFLASSSIAVGLGLPEVFRRAALAAPASDQPGGKQTVLVVVQLTGGNDGLNTVIPFRDPAYHAARPSLKQPADKVKRLNDDVALHPSLGGLASLWEGSRLGMVQGVGYPNPNRSHFESMDVWHKATDSREQRYGWLGRMHAQLGPAGMALHIGSGDPPLALFGPTGNAPSVKSLDEYQLRVAPKGDDPARRALIEGFANSASPPKNELLALVKESARETYRSSQRLREKAGKYDTPVVYPSTNLGNRMKLIARLITAGVPERLYYTTHDGFDTHAIQEQFHPGLLQDLGDSIAAFHKDVAHHGDEKRVVVMTFSEFGRRVKENASQGTDHGAASQMFLVGDTVKAGVTGKHPSLTDLDDGDLKHHTDFRSVYGTLLEKWLGIPHEPVLGAKYPELDLLRA
ncbi:MAG: DUF1501 domain-containing protein [Planctomycetaceae bacterium]|nr:DUF1501 domain-containing protein [Planctomycetaceae bacterium]